MDESEFYRQNVGIMIINRFGEVWVGKRMGGDRYRYKQQMPQGGIDIGETPKEAAYRELWEETGLTSDSVILLAESKNWHTYNFPFPKKYGSVDYVGQRQKWFLFLYDGDGHDFNLRVCPKEMEFESYAWFMPQKVLTLVVPFKRSVYRLVLKEFQPQIKEVVQKFSKISTASL